MLEKHSPGSAVRYSNIIHRGDAECVEVGVSFYKNFSRRPQCLCGEISESRAGVSRAKHVLSKAEGTQSTRSSEKQENIFLCDLGDLGAINFPTSGSFFSVNSVSQW
jgi:hypothetical protein